MKAYTDLEQSKKLAEILPLESADMHYIIMGDDEDLQSMVGLGKYIGVLPTIPCWSLAALLDIIPNASLQKIFTGWRCYARCYACLAEGRYLKIANCADNPIDVCVTIIIKLHEKNLL